MREMNGQDIGLRLIGNIGAIRSHRAQHITWHTHKGFELLFLLDGNTAYEFRKQSSIQITGGSLLVLPPVLVHRGVGDVRSPSTILGIECIPDRHNAASRTPFTATDLTWIRDLLKNSAFTVHPLGRDLRHTVGKLFKLVEQHAGNNPGPQVQAIMRTLCCTVLVEAAENLNSSRNKAPQEIITAAIRFLENRFQEQLQINDLVKHLGFSRARVFELFKEHTGMTPNDYLLRYRIRKAQETLADRTKSVTDIALSTGFSSSQYFSQVFLKYTGKTPSQYRSVSTRTATVTRR